MLQVPTTPEVEAKLAEKARALGLDVPEFAARVLDREVSTATPHSEAVDDKAERLRFLTEWVSSLPPRPGPPVDDSRDSIYE